jgi:ribosomal protein S12 methylthiotransferase RimO
MDAHTTVYIHTLGCARNEVDSEEMAARFIHDGFQLVESETEAEVIVVNTCGFIEPAKNESIAEILSAAQVKNSSAKVIAAGCLAQRYGDQLARALPEADGVVGFDDLDQMATRIRGLLAGHPIIAHQPHDRRLLPVVSDQPHSSGPQQWQPTKRVRLSDSPIAPLKIATGCDRKCAFCSIPSFRGRFQSRPVMELRQEAEWLATQGVKELFLVSENTTSYGKDLPSHTLEGLLGELNKVDGIDRIRLSYLQPAEVRPSLIEAIASTDKVVNYFDLPFQHASGAILSRMRRFGDGDSYLELLTRIRRAMPQAGIRTNVIVGFPGETTADVEVLTSFLADGQFDAVGVFAYSDEEGTEAAGLDKHVDDDEIRARASTLAQFVDTLTSGRAEDRIGEQVRVLVESTQDNLSEGRAEQQGPEDGASYLTGDHQIGQIVEGIIADTDGVDWQIRV